MCVPARDPCRDVAACGKCDNFLQSTSNIRQCGQPAEPERASCMSAALMCCHLTSPAHHAAVKTPHISSDQDSAVGVPGKSTGRVDDLRSSQDPTLTKYSQGASVCGTYSAQRRKIAPPVALQAECAACMRVSRACRPPPTAPVETSPQFSCSAPRGRSMAVRCEPGRRRSARRASQRGP